MHRVSGFSRMQRIYRVFMCLALHVAVHCGHLELVDVLLNRGALINAAEYQHGFTPLHLAAQTGRQAIIVCTSSASSRSGSSSGTNQ